MEDGDLHEVLDQLPAGLCLIDPDGNLQYANRTLAGWTGIRPAKLAGRKCREAFDWTICRTDLCPRRRILDGADRVGPLPVNAGCGEGGCPGAMTAWALREDGGRVSGIVEQVSRPAPWNLAAFAHTDRTAMLLCDGDGSILSAWGGGLQRCLGRSPEDLCRRNLADFLPLEPAAARLVPLREAVERNESVHDEHLAPTSKGEVWLEMTYVPVPQAASQPPLVLAIGRDISREKQVEQTLERKNLALQELLGSIEDAKTQMGRQIQASLDGLILPLLRDIQERLREADRPLVDVLEGQLREICSPYAQRISHDLAGFTPHELRIAGLIRSGMSSKEIARLEHISTATVNKHREHIRHKLAISGKHVNLGTYLQSLGADQAGGAPGEPPSRTSDRPT